MKSTQTIFILMALVLSQVFPGDISKFTSNTQGYGLSAELSAYANPHLYYAFVNEYNGEATALKFPIGDKGVSIQVRMDKLSYGLAMIAIYDIEARSNIPSDIPQNYQTYTLAMPYVAYKTPFLNGLLYGSLSTELEQTVNYNTTLIGFSAAYGESFNALEISAGIRDLSVRVKTSDDYISNPVMVYSSGFWRTGKISILGEINSGEFLVRAGINYKLASLFQVQSGIQYDADAKSIYGSFGFDTNIENFKFGFSVSNLLHDLGPTSHYSISWMFR